MTNPEPQTIPEYQHELFRVWDTLLKVEEKAYKVQAAAHAALEEVELLRHYSNDIKDIINRVKKRTTH